MERASLGPASWVPLVPGGEFGGPRFPPANKELHFREGEGPLWWGGGEKLDSAELGGLAAARKGGRRGALGERPGRVCHKPSGRGRAKALLFRAPSLGGVLIGLNRVGVVMPILQM